MSASVWRCKLASCDGLLAVSRNLRPPPGPVFLVTRFALDQSYFGSARGPWTVTLMLCLVEMLLALPDSEFLASPVTLGSFKPG